MSAAEEAAGKLERLRALLHDRGAEGIVLRQTANFAWLTGGGRSFIPVTAELGAAVLAVTRWGRVVLIANNIESLRLRDEEMPHLSASVSVLSYPWWDEGGLLSRIREAIPEGRILADWPLPGAVDVRSELVALRTALCAEEQRRARALGQDTAAALEAATRQIQPGQCEFAIAGELARRCLERGIEPVVHLVAADDRVFSRRHPLPTDRRVERYAMVAVCGMRGGLVVSATRLWHLGTPSDEIVRRWRAAATVDAEMIAASQPGVSLAEVLAVAQRTYAEQGFPHEWAHHHQGGLAGYQSREERATPEATTRLNPGQMVAWNPSVAGAKSEDTLLVPAQAGALPEIITQTGQWPTEAVSTKDGRRIPRPAIFVAEP